MIGTASFTSVFMIGPFVKFPSIPQIPSFVFFSLIQYPYYTWFPAEFHL